MLRIIVLTVVTTVLISTSILVAEDETDQMMRTISKLREEISLTNLTNGLNLSEAQLAELIKVLKEAEGLRKTYTEQHRMQAEEMVKAFSTLKKELQNGPHLPQEIATKASNYNESAKEILEKIKKEIMPFQDKVEKILTEAQKMVIDDFKPCLLPPKSQKDPVRVGQAKGSERAIGLLRKLRETPSNVYIQKREDALQRYFAQFEEKKGKLSDEEKTKEKARLFGLADRVRAMSAEEFELNKQELAEEFIIKDKAEDLEKELKEILEYRRKDKHGMSKIGKYFLKPEMLSILETRLQNLRNFRPTEPVNLDDIKVAPEKIKDKKRERKSE
ncbi:MAG: hypothetical protein QME51_01505 [Planctomycetota bacterium]|nr:hypothetical protein [Planctomycetota bacterium]MDI6787031.1 hypothetical protein [Planctomycetota bacterium]